MLYKVNGGTQYLYTQGDPLTPLKTNQDLLVVFDPGKTNMAVLIGTVTGEIIMILELSGKDENQRAIDTTDYCYDFRKFLTTLLSESTVYLFGQEAAILPNEYGKGNNHKAGMNHYHSQMVLTEVRSNLINLSMDMIGKKPEQVNNMAWKGAILPDGYRGRNEKGSQRFMRDFAPQFAQYSHDVTDVICIYMYLVHKYKDKVEIKCNRDEETSYAFTMSIVDRSALPSGVKYFQFSTQHSCEENAKYFVNRSKELGACKLDIDVVRAAEIYQLATGLTTESDPYLVVKRK